MSVEIDWPYMVHNVRSAPIRTHQARQWAIYHDIDELKLLQAAIIHPRHKDTWFTEQSPTEYIGLRWFSGCQCDYCKTERDYIGD